MIRSTKTTIRTIGSHFISSGKPQPPVSSTEMTSFGFRLETFASPISSPVIAAGLLPAGSASTGERPVCADPSFTLRSASRFALRSV
jgi:hypothetical protein